MSFFDKLKQGVSQAGNTAKNTMEETRLKSQIKKINDDINAYYLSIGKEIYLQSQNNEKLDFNAISNSLEQINNLNLRKDEITLEIEKIWDRKICSCGASVPLASKFCPTCGSKFEEPVIIESEVVTQEKLVSDVSIEKTSSTVDTSAYICKVCDAELEENSKFCGACGSETNA